MRTLRFLSNFTLMAFISFFLSSNLAFADPPDWAPAHGYHKNKHKDKRKNKHRDDNYRYSEPRQGQQHQYEPLSCEPYSSRNSEMGTVIGGIIGGILGSKIGKGDGKTLATIAGVIVGATIGNTVGESMDDADKYCAGQAFVNAEDSQSVAWVNPDTQRQYTVTPDNTYTRDNGRYCRDYTSSVMVNGQRTQATGTACRENGGNWQIIN